MRKLPVFFALLLALPLAAQFPAVETIAAQPNSPECALGLKYDNNTFTGFINSSNPNWIAVMRFDLPQGTTGLRQVCVRLVRTTLATNNVPYDIMVFDDNGPSGSPGTVLKSISGTATFPGTESFVWVTADLTNSGLALPDNGVFVGIRLSVNTVAILIDSSAGIPARPLYFSETNGFAWAIGSSSLKAFSIRVDPIPECIPSPTALCLNGRFKVEATYTTASASGAANVVKLTEETGYLWFFNSTNVEAVVKVLNGCGINNSFWVYAGGLTDVNTVLRVTDVRTGQVKTYTNPQGTPFQPIQDVNAFSGAGICP